MFDVKSKTGKRKITWKNIKYFKPDEFMCPCCGRNEISLDFVFRLDVARGFAGEPFVITSGYRCERHNKFVGGVPGSAHLKGLAADIYAKDDQARYKILRGLILAGFRRIGLGRDFIHVDIDESKPQGRIWIYGGVRNA